MFLSIITNAKIATWRKTVAAIKQYDWLTALKLKIDTSGKTALQFRLYKVYNFCVVATV